MKQRSLLLPLLFSTGLVAAFVGGFAPASFGQANPCEDPVYLKLVEKDLDSMSDREFSVFQDKSTACTEFLLTHGTRTGTRNVDDTALPDSLRPRYRTKGVSFRAHVGGASWHLDDSRLFDEQNRGGGLGVGLSYGVSELITLVLNLDAAGMQPDFGQDYTLSHADLGVRFTFASDSRRLRPFAQISLTGFEAERDLGFIVSRVSRGPGDSGDFRDHLGDEVQVTGGGLTLGGGIMYFFNPKLALDVGLDLTLGQVSSIKYRDIAIDQHIDSFSSRLNVGLAWYPWH